MDHAEAVVRKHVRKAGPRASYRLCFTPLTRHGRFKPLPFEEHVLDCLMAEQETFSREIWRWISRYEHFLLHSIVEAIANQSKEVRNQFPALLTADLRKYLKSVEEFVDIYTGERNFRPYRIKVTREG